MGSYHGAEVCELVGLYMMSELCKLIPKSHVGLYRDDGLAIIKKQSGYMTEKLKKNIYKIAKEIGLSFEIEGPMKKTDFLDIAFDIEHGSYRPFRKINNEIKYIRTDSNHPNTIIKQIPTMISKRLSKRSMNKEEFNKISNAYNAALQKSGYKEKVTFEPKKPQNKKNRKRKTIWFNPPFCKTVQTNIAKKFIVLIKKHFNEDHPLKKIFNKNSINVSYSCMQNIARIISSHNKKLLEEKKKETLPCNCRKECPLPSNKFSCRTKNVIYQAEVETDKERKTYIGLTALEFKKRVANHKTDFKYKKKQRFNKIIKPYLEFKRK